MLGITQEEFIGAVRDAMERRGHGHGHEAEAPASREAARVVRPTDDIVERFCEMVADAKMTLYQVAGEGVLVDTIVRIVRAIGARSVLLTDEPLPRREALEAALRDAGCSIADLRQNDCAFDSDVGITLARMGIAETGSIVIRSGPNTRRLASLAVPEHIALLRKDQIVPDLLDWAASLGEAMPANEVLITGPSKTSDIESNLVMGVHGPKNVHVVLIA